MRYRTGILHTLLAVLCCSCMPAFAQQVTDTLKEVKIKAKKEEKPVAGDKRISIYSPGQDVYTVDSIMLEQYQFQSMANLLSQQVPVFVKSYGVNNIATLNFRGASAAQSQVYWNGVPIQNAALGIADVSLLPVSLMNRVQVVYGSSSALLGSGNVGGALMVDNIIPTQADSNRFTQSVSVVTGSFGQYRFGLKSVLYTERFAVSGEIFGQTSRNDFRYTDADDAVQHMSNAELSSGTGLLQVKYNINNAQSLDAKVWYQQYYREIPRALFESASVKTQRDESLRLLLQWDRKGEATATYARVAYIKDNMEYRDSMILLSTDNATQQLYAEAGADHRFNSHHRLLVFAPVHISWMERVTQGDIKTQNKYALAAAYLLTAFNDRLEVSLNGRGEVINDISVLLPGLNTSYTVNKWLEIKGNVQKTFRAPTLNELYYEPGGNPSLRPEKGWNEEIGYSINTPVKGDRKLSVQHHLAVYNRVVNDWILWFGGAIWTPHNIATVHSRGVQTENSLRYHLRTMKVHFSINAAYTFATTMKSDLPGDGSIGKQIPYTPLYNGQANAGITWKGLYLNYNQAYTGLRYITTDESYALPAYTTGNLQLMYNLLIKDNVLQLNAQVNNIWNESYQVVNARPMPGTNWLLGVSFTLK